MALWDSDLEDQYLDGDPGKVRKQGSSMSFSVIITESGNSCKCNFLGSFQGKLFILLVPLTVSIS